MKPVPPHIEALLTEIGPQTPQIDAVIFNDDPDESTPSWALEFENNFSVLAEWRPEPPSLLLTAELGRADDVNMLSVYESLLTLNAMYAYTGGVTGSVGGPGGSVMLSQAVPMEEPTLRDFRNTLLNFSALGRAWTAYVDNPAIGLARATEKFGAHLARA